MKLGRASGKVLHLPLKVGHTKFILDFWHYVGIEIIE